MTSRRVISVLIAVVSTIASVVAFAPVPASAAVYPGDTGTVYKEYWVPHATWTGGCPEHGLFKPNNAWYLEPGPCIKTITFNIPDNVSNVAKVEVYIDLWRNYTGRMSARFKLNNGPIRQPMVGYDWSRTPWIQEIPVGELKQGQNTMVFTAADGRFHAHDIAFRVYHDAAHPLVAGSGSDVTPPTVNLTTVSASNGSFNAAAGGTLQINNDQIGLAADSTGASKVEFHAYFDGYDTDNNGQTRDWQAFIRQNWNVGGSSTKPAPPTGATLGIPGTDLTAPYAVTWSLPHVVSQSGVKFKARAVDAAGNVRETPASAAFTLSRSFGTSMHRVAGFVDFPLYANGAKPTTGSVTITLPSLAGVTNAYLIGHFWQNPFIKINGNAAFTAFTATEDVWDTSIRAISVGQLRAGANTITYNYNSAQIRYGQFVERPGPMIVLRGGSGGGTVGISITQQPAPVTVPEGQAATFSVAANSSRGAVTLQWRRNGAPIPGATASTYTTAPVTPADNGALFDVVVADGTDTLASGTARLTVGTAPPGGRTLSVENASVTEGTGSAVTLSFKVTLSSASSSPVTVRVSTVPGGTATAVADYTARSAVVTIPAGRKSVSFGVPVAGDSLDESNETVNVLLSDPSGAAIAGAAGTGTIVDND